MTDSKLEIILTAKDLAAGAFHSVNGYVTKLTSSIFSLKGAFSVLAGGAGAGIVINSLSKMADAASDFSETASKSLTLFGSAEADKISEWAKTAAETMGLSRQEAIEATATMGTMFVQLGAGVDTASKLSRGMIQLSADIASYNNVSGGAQAVSEAMQSAFRGEYDALQRYIPTINAAAVQQQALADTGKRTASELTQLDKALATQKIIMRDAGAAAGDFARTSGGLANQERILAARIEDLKVSLGEGLLPAKTKIVTEISNWVDANSELLAQNMSSWAENLSQSFDGMAKAIGAVANGLATISKYAGLRSISRTAAQGAELAQQGRLDFEAFMKAGFMDRQEMVDALLNDQTGKRFKIKAPAETAPFQPPPAPVPTPNAATLQREIDGIDRELEKYFGDLDKLQEYQRDFRVDTALEDYFKDLDIAELNVFSNIDQDLNDFFGDLDRAEAKIGNTTDAWKNAFIGWGNSFSQTLTDAVWDSEISFGKIAESFGRMITQMAIQKQVVEPVFSNLFTANAAGGVYRSPSLASYEGLVTNKPHFFTFANGGVFGEAGYEAIMPLKRTAGGKLGVEASGSAPKIDVHINPVNESGIPLDVQPRIIRESEDQVVANLMIKRRMTSRGFRQAMGVT